MNDEKNTEKTQKPCTHLHFFLHRILASYSEIQEDYEKEFGTKLPQVKAIASMVFTMHRSFEELESFNFYQSVIAELIAIDMLARGEYIPNPDYKEPRNDKND